MFISIHLMLLFIGICCKYNYGFNGYFNTSHVTVYRSRTHLIPNNLLFQYISCYCLSIRTGKKEQSSYNFNTSHVTVYRQECINYGMTADAFQYISCYCLSQRNTIKEGANKQFQYISCYCLSSKRINLRGVIHISIHLMLLFIYIGHYCDKIQQDFNTSHVTVYHN